MILLCQKGTHLWTEIAKIETKTWLCDPGGVSHFVTLYFSPNFFILDEPTNHLDMETIEALGNALNKFQVSLWVVKYDFLLL